MTRLSVNDFRASISSITSFTPLFNPEVRELDTLLRVFSAQVTLWITSPATLAAMEKGFGIPRLAIPLLFFNLTQGVSGTGSFPRDLAKLEMSGMTPLIALMAVSASSFSGLSVHALIKGIMSIMILLDIALALELAAVPVAPMVIGGAVVGIVYGVVKSPPMITGTNLVVPDSTWVIVETRG